MEHCGPDYLARIPDELKIEIFCYLNTIDIVQLSQISAFEGISCDKHLISNINLFKEYLCGIDVWKNFVLNKLRTNLITTLNINCIYWISASDLRKGLAKLQMLENFYAVDTKLGFTAADTMVYNSLPNLKSLAITIFDRELECSGVYFPPTLVNLYLHLELIKHESVTKLSFLLCKLKDLKEFWVVDLSPSRTQITVTRVLCLIPSALEKLTLMIHRVADLALVNTLNITGTLTFKSFKKDLIQISFEKLDSSVKDIYNNWEFKDAYWKFLINRLKYDDAFGQRDVKKLILGQYLPEDLKYEELNITHGSDICSQLFKSTAELLLTSPNTTLLKKISINFCLCSQSGNEITKKEEPLFKRARVGVSNSLPRKSALEKIVEHSPLIEELELWACKTSNLSKITNAALCSIQKLSNLKKLTLHCIPEHIDGQFLIPVCKSCRNLSSLRIKTTKGNSNLHNYVCMALPYATALKDFRYQRYYIPVDRLMETLNGSTDLKLERVVVKCQTIEKFTIDPFRTFLDMNPQLKFVCVVITQASKNVIRDISKTLNNYKTSAEKVYIATNDESIYNGRLPIPHIHRRQMLNFETAVSVLDIFNGFTKC